MIQALVMLMVNLHENTSGGADPGGTCIHGKSQRRQSLDSTEKLLLEITCLAWEHFGF